MSKKRKFRPSLPEPIAVSNLIFEVLASMGGQAPMARLSSLWQNWEQAMGKDLAALATPIGTQGRILIMGCSNSMQMQEAQYYGEDIRSSANGFIGSEWFENVRFSLHQRGKKCSLQKEPIRENRESKVKKPRLKSAATGKYLDQMDMNSLVAQCYAKYAGKGE